jgi:hypothetical protein
LSREPREAEQFSGLLLSFSSDGRMMAATTYSGYDVVVWDIANIEDGKEMYI